MAARDSKLWPWAAVALLAAIAVVDASAGDELIFTTAFLLPVLALALVARPEHVAPVGALALGLAVLSGIWDDYFLSGDHLVRLSVISLGLVLAVLSARARAAAEADRARMALLAEIGRITDAPGLETALERLGSALVPAVAERAWVDLADDGERRRILDRGAAGDAEQVVIPLRIRDRPIGELGFAGRAYDDEDRAFFGVLAGRVALALGNVRLLRELTRTRERLDRTLGALAEAVTVHDARGKTIYANDAAVELLGAESLEEVLSAEPGELGARFLISHEDGSPVAVEEFPGRRLVAGEPDPPPLLTRSVHRESGREYWLLTKATLQHDEEGRPLAVNVIEDVTEAKEGELRQRFLDEAGQLLASSLDYEQALRGVARLAVPWLADWCAVDLVTPEGLRRVAAAHTDPAKVGLADELARRYPPDPEAEAGVPAVVRTGRAERYNEIPDELIVQSARDEEHLRLIRQVGMRAALVVPMTAGDETLGALTLVSAESGRTFEDDDLAFAQDLARRAATAVQNGRLYAEQVRVARTLQRSLLPDRLPEVPGWEAGASYEAGDTGSDVGGDFYDVVETGIGHLVFLGDVTGKGVEAAALTALVRHSARMAARFDPRPSALLGVLNAVLREQPRLSPVSVVCALIEHGDDGPARVTVASAGHPLPLLKRDREPPREIGRHDVLLGVVDQDAFAEDTIEVDVGDVLLFYTDGVIDAPGGEGRFGEARLLDAVAAAPAAPPALLHTIEAALREFDAEGADDRAMIALRHTGARASLGARLAGTRA
ncbi:MAG TPA: SpoIIE family protein phosphatase [Solirubrobacteraceae bacterium]|nr:SpoIIE family protein phosphatase [Solirubrobacteraceae bacterium]